MALSSITNMVLVSDVLTETKMKPWWEVVRGKCVAVMFISALTMLTLSLTSTIHCLPTFSNMSLTNPEILYVNGLCYDDLPSYSSKNMGTYVIAIALGIHIWYSWWLLVPSVKAKFHVVRNADDTLKKLTLIQHRIKELALCEPFDSRSMQQTNENNTAERSIEDKRISVRNVLRRLWPCHPTGVVILYFVRNIVGFLLLSGAIVFSIFSFKLTGQNTRYPCKVTLRVREVTFHDFTCSSESLHVPFLALLSAYTASIIVQWLFTTVVCCCYCYKCCCNVNDWMLIKRFAASSTKLFEGTENLLLDKDEVVKTMTGYLEEAAKVGDFDYLDLYLKLGDSAEMNEQMRESFKRRINNNEVKDKDISGIVKFCSEKAMYESFVLAHYKNFGQNSEKNYDYEDCGCCNLKINLSDKDTYTKNSLLQYVLTSRAKTENGQVIFNRLAIKHLLYWIIGGLSSNEIRDITLQLVQQIQQVQQQNDEIKLFELSLILQECGYGHEIRITPENQDRYNVYSAIRNLKQVDDLAQQVNFVFEDHNSFYSQMSIFWFKNKMFKEYFHLHKLIYDKDICPGMDKFDIHGYCGCNELNFEQDDTEPGPSGCSLLYHVLKNPDVKSEAMKHVLYWMSKWKGWRERNIRGSERVQLSVREYLTKVCKRPLWADEDIGIMGSFLQVAAKALVLEVMSLTSDTREEFKHLRDGFVTRMEQRAVTDDDLQTITRFCMEHKMYEVFVLVHYKWFEQNRDEDFDYVECDCHDWQFVEESTDSVTGKSLLYHVLQPRSRNEEGENIFNFLAIEHLLYWISKYQVSQREQVCLGESEKSDVRYQSGQPEKLELSFLLDNYGYGDDVGFTNENHHYHNFYRAIRNGGEVAEEMKNFVLGDDKSFYKELSQFWLRNKFYREYVELHKLFYSFRNDLNHENIDCGCNKMIFHLTDTEPGSEGRSLIYYVLVLVYLDRGSEAMNHVLKLGRERQDVSEDGEVKVVIRGASYVDCSPMEYVENFNEPARERLIQALQEFGYHVVLTRDEVGNDNLE